MRRLSPSQVRRRHALTEYGILRRIARGAGYHLVRANYYSPIPDLDEIPPRVWSDPDEMSGVAWDLDGQLSFLEHELGPWLSELGGPGSAPRTREGYFPQNEFFNVLDAEVLHAVLRRLRPSRVLELGSGFSTLVIAGATDRNAQEGAPVRHEVYDPFPSPVLAGVRDRFELHGVGAAEIPLTRFAELRAGDVLFIDTTHTVKPAGDVVHVLLGALPLLAPGVVVHIHDFFRPFEYPRVLLTRFGSYWQEHYLVQAFLAFNPEYQVLCANHALSRLRRDRVQALVPGLDLGTVPSSLWLRRRMGEQALKSSPPVAAASRE